MPQAIDIVFFITAAGIVVAELKRGVGRALLDLITLFIALLAANAAAPVLSLHAGFSPSPPINFGWSYGICFAAFATVALTIARVADNIFRWTFGVMDAPLGAATGLCLAVLVLHAVAVTLNFGGAGIVAESTLGGEALNFKTYHTIVDGFTALGSHQILSHNS